MNVNISAQILNHNSESYVAQLSSDFFNTVDFTSSPVIPDEFGIAKFRLEGLPDDGIQYEVRIADSLGNPIDSSDYKGSFIAPAPAGFASYFRFAFGSCSWSDGSSASNSELYERLSEKAVTGDLDFFIHLGDLHYSDISENIESLYQDAYNKVFSSPRQNNCWKDLPMYYMWDDHDYGPNDGNKNNTSRPAAIAAYRGRVPHPPTAKNGTTDSPYYSFTRGRVRFVMTDIRSEREPKGSYPSNDVLQKVFSPDQENWFFGELLAAKNNGEIIVWANTNPWVSAIEDGKDDWGGYHAARARIVDFINLHSLQDRIVIISGDMHALAFDDGTSVNNYGSLKVCHAGPLDQEIRPKGGPYKVGPITQDSGTGWATQYGIIEFIDSGINTIDVNFKGIVVDKTTFIESVVIDETFTLNSEALPVDPICGENTSYSNPGGSGNRTASGITITHNMPTNGGNVQTLLDGTKFINTFYFVTKTLTSSDYIQIDFGVSRNVTQITWSRELEKSIGSWQIRGSDDGSTWQDIGGQISFSQNSKVYIFNLCTNTIAFRYYRLQGVSGLLDQSWDWEFEFKIDEGPAELTTLPNLYYWYKADDGPQVISGEVVSWTDKAVADGTARNLVPPSTAKRPSFLTNQINGLPAVQFSDDQLNYPAVPLAADRPFNNTTVFMVSQTTSNSQYPRLLAWIPNNSALDYQAPDGACIVWNNGLFGVQHRTVAAQIYPSTIGSTRPTGFFSSCLKISSTDFVIYINGVKKSGDSVRTTWQSLPFVDGTSVQLRVGAGTDNAQPFYGKIAEIIIYDRILNDQEIYLVNNYLNNKYGLSEVSVTSQIVTPQYVTQGDIINPQFLARPGSVYSLNYNSSVSSYSPAFKISGDGSESFLGFNFDEFGSEIAIDNNSEYIFIAGPKDERISSVPQGAIWCFTGDKNNGWDLFQKIICEDPSKLNIGSQNIRVSPDYERIIAGSDFLPILFSGSKSDGWVYVKDINFSGFDPEKESIIYFDTYNAASDRLFISTYKNGPFTSGNGKVNLITYDY
jgi:alkaline phosphatase D